MVINWTVVFIKSNAVYQVQPVKQFMYTQSCPLILRTFAINSFDEFQTAKLMSNTA